MATAEDGIKSEAQRLVAQLSPGAFGADLMYAIYVRQQIEEGIRDADAGRVVTTEQLRQDLGLAF